MVTARFGMFVPQGWKLELAAITDPAEGWATTTGVALAAEAAGYDSIWVYDHLQTRDPAQEAIFECWTTLAALAVVTSTVRLGQMVGCAGYRPPGLLAKITSNVDVISGGRLEWGIGAGWDRAEFEAYGYPFPPASERIAMLRETVEIVTAMWSRPETTYHGRHHRVDGARCDPKPLQRPRPPVWIGGAGERLTLRLVAELADKWNFGGPAQDFARKRDVLRAHCAEIGRDPDEIELTWSPDVCIRDAEADIERLYDAGRLGPVGGPFREWAAAHLVGTPDQVADKVAAHVDLGCTYFVPWCADYPSTETLERFARSVAPHFR